MHIHALVVVDGSAKTGRQGARKVGRDNCASSRRFSPSYSAGVRCCRVGGFARTRHRSIQQNFRSMIDIAAVRSKLLP
jgi:hypothetical protein